MTSPNESNEVMRADFESWINATYGHDCIRRDEAGDYEDIATCSQWDAWQAASIVTPQPQTVREKAVLHFVDVWDDYDKPEDSRTYASGALRDAIEKLKEVIIEPLSVTDSVAVQEPLVTVIGSAPDITMSYMLDRALPVGTKLYAAPTLDKE